MAQARKRIRVAVVTGSRAEFGLLCSVMRAIEEHPSLELQVIAAGSHLVGPARTIREVTHQFKIAAKVRMQLPSHATRPDDALAVARGIAGFTRAYQRLRPDWAVVLGDRIEAFAAASAASIAGIAVAHLHGGDRAEGIADEAMRHAITKLAHLHLPATPTSGKRLIRMGEDPRWVRVIGSPAIDQLASIRPMSDSEASTLGDPHAVILLHPSGLPDAQERRIARALVTAARTDFGDRVLILEPNHDAGRGAILSEWKRSPRSWTQVRHLPRHQFLSLLARLAHANPRGVLIGNSSAGLIEAAALGTPVVNIGPRQAGRERCANVRDVSADSRGLSVRISQAILRARSKRFSDRHPYGTGRAGPLAAQALASINPHDQAMLRKRNTY